MSCQDALLRAAAATDHGWMRPEVHAFVADGPLPDWDASEEEIDRRDKQLADAYNDAIHDHNAVLVTDCTPA